MAKKTKRKYSPSAGRDVESEMRRYKRGTAKNGRGGKGGKVKSRKQAIAIGLSKARKKGKRVPKKKGGHISPDLPGDALLKAWCLCRASSTAPWYIVSAFCQPASGQLSCRGGNGHRKNGRTRLQRRTSDAPGSIRPIA